jgi:aryl-alcohol dehydrogenase-like predicted oxidoreductase
MNILEKSVISTNIEKVGKNIIKLGIGTVQFGLPYGISNLNGQTPPEEVSKILDIARNNKINFIDTASAYGNAEMVLGQYNAREFNIISKYMPALGEKISTQLYKSLNHLNVKYLYGYLAHRPSDILTNPEEWKELLQLKEEGLVKKIGFSLNEISELEKLLEKGFTPDLIQIPFNYFDNRFEKYAIFLKSIGCEIHARSVFLQGLFFVPTDTLSNYFNDIKPFIKSLQDSTKYLSGSLLKYVLEKQFIDKVIIGVDNAQYLTYNLDTLHLAEDLPSFEHNLSDKFLNPSSWPKAI